MDDTGFNISSKGLEVTRALTFEEWKEIGGVIVTMGNASRWAKGDWLLEGRTKYPEMYAQALDGRQMSAGGVSNAMRLSERFKPGMRTVSVSPDHYAAVMTWNDDDAMAMLQRAYNEGMTRDDVRVEVRRNSRKCPECRQIMMLRGDHFICNNPECEHDMPADTPEPEPLKLVTTVSASVNGQIVVMDERLRAGKIYKVTITEVAA